MKRSKRIFLTVIFSLSSVLYGWDGATHSTITARAVTISKVDNYLQNQLGLNTQLNDFYFETSLITRLNKARLGTDMIRSIMEWIQVGSMIQDEDEGPWHHFSSWIKRNHFHDPSRNAGLDNHTDHPTWTASGFIPQGTSALSWATNGSSPFWPNNNYETWLLTREHFRLALTLPNKENREGYLAQTFLGLGSVLHLLEDMGVPDHTFLNAQAQK